MNSNNNSETNQILFNFGPLHGNVEKQEIHTPPQSAEVNETESNSLSIGSPLHLSNKKGTKIDFIRVMNAWYECGKVEDVKGGKPTKIEFFTWIGRLFNIDLSDYDKDLSNSMASSVAYDKQTRIFDELKEKQQEIFNGK